ncbi:MAG: hypothetical protein QXG39_06585 [Candidatus Aenigmatarchaeota archaeon]
MEGGKVRKFIPFVLFFLGVIIPKVYAVDETGEVNLLDLPAKLADALGIPLFAGQILACLIFLFIFLLPVAVFSKRNPTLIALLVGVPLLCFFVAVGWLHYWVLLVVILLVAVLYSDKVKEWIT